jgi:hypothetical protein
MRFLITFQTHKIYFFFLNLVVPAHEDSTIHIPNGFKGRSGRRIRPRSPAILRRGFPSPGV